MSRLERVAVMGTSGSGKTTFARELASLLGAPHVELDALYWGPNWTPRVEFVEDVTRAAAQPRWVADGNYSAVRDVLWSRATTVVWLDYAFLRTFGRALNRTVRRMISGETVYAGNRESFRNAFLDFNGIPWWVLRTYRGRRREMPLLMQRTEYRHIDFRVLCNPSEAAAFLRDVGTRVMRNGADDGEFLARFEAAAISRESWTHRDHVRVAFLYLRALPFAEAVSRIRTGIQALNRANGIADDTTSGYHETITVAWARLVAGAVASGAAADTFADFAERNPDLLNKERLRVHYSRDLIMSPRARASFVDADLAPLPFNE